MSHACNPIEAKSGNLEVLVNANNKDMIKGIQKQCKEKYSKLKKLTINEWATNRAPHIVLTTAVPKNTGGNDITEKYCGHERQQFI